MTYDAEPPFPAQQPPPLYAPPTLHTAPEPAPELPVYTTVEPLIESAEEPAARPKPARRKGADAGRQRALIMRTARKTLEIHQADALTKGLLATVVGTSGSADEIAYAVLSGGAKSIQSAVDALSIIDADVLEAGIHAAALGRARLRSVWRVFAELGVVAGEAPSSDAKAAIALVRALHEGDTGAVRADIDAAVSLANR